MPDLERPFIKTIVEFAPQVAAPAVTLLYPVIVGPGYSLHKLAPFGEYDPAFEYSFEIPAEPNTEFDAAFTKIYIQEPNMPPVQLPVLVYEGEATTTATSTELRSLNFIGLDIAKDDKVIFINPVNIDSTTVASVNAAQDTITLTVAHNLPANKTVKIRILKHEPTIDGRNITIPKRGVQATSSQSSSASIIDRPIHTDTAGDTVSRIEKKTNDIQDVTLIRVDSIDDWQLLGYESAPQDDQKYFKVVGTVVVGITTYYLIKHPPALAAGTSTNHSIVLWSGHPIITIGQNDTVSRVEKMDADVPVVKYIEVSDINDWRLLGFSSAPSDDQKLFEVVGEEVVNDVTYYLIKHPPALTSGRSTTNDIVLYSVYPGSLKGAVYATYRALKQDLGIFLLSSADEISNILGEPDPDNPLAFGLQMAFLNTNTAVYGIGIRSNDVTGYNEAKEYLSQYNVYSIVPLTFDPTVLASYANFVAAMSSPDVSKPRMLIASREVPDKKTVLLTGNAKIIDADTGPSGTKLTYTDSSYDIQLGDLIEVTIGTSTTPPLKVISVDKTAKTFILDGWIKVKTDTDVTFVQYRLLTKLEQAQALQSNPYTDRHVVEILPDYFINYSVGSTRLLPMYFGAAGLAGINAAFLPQIQLNGQTIAGIDNIIHSNYYFTEDLMKSIAGSGKLYLIQDTPTDIPFIRNQVTTDMSSLLKRSLNIIKAIDAVLYMATGVLKTLLRKYNVVPETLELIYMNLRAVINAAQRTRAPGAGGIIMGGKIIEVKRDPDAPNGVLATVELVFPAPLETITLTLRVSV